MEKHEASMTKQQLQVYAKDLAKIFKSEKGKRAELSVAHSKLKASFEAIESGIISLDAALNITEANNSFCTLADKTIEEIIGKSVTNTLSSDNWSRLYIGLTELLEPDKILINVFGDSSLYYNVSRSPLLSKDGKVFGWVLIFSNETEIRRSNQLKDEFISLVSHEIRTPLAVIMGYMDLLIEILPERLTEDEMTFLTAIKDNGDRLVRTVKELLELANQSLAFPKVSMEVVDLRTSVESAISKAAQVIHVKRISVDRSLPVSQCAVFADHDMLTTAILHILENAIEFSPERSSITVTLTADDDQWLLMIQDQGIGIPKSEQNKVFNTYYQVERHMTRTHEGIGLGLSLVRRTAALHGGSVEIESEEGQGTKVFLRIPFYRPSEKEVLEKQLKELESEIEFKEAKANDYQTQLSQYAKDFSKIYISEKSKRHELKEKNEQLKRYARDLTTTVKDLKLAQVELHMAYLDTIYRLSLVAEYKDKDTANHIVRMSRYSAIIATHLNMAEEEIENLRYAAPMHDIGKVGIPDNILTKEGKLEELEFTQMKEHPNIGGTVLTKSNAKILNLAEEIANTHHEKWDGSGYPNGLLGEEIPLSGRIVALADVFDALSSKRPYKDPYPINLVCDIIKKESGKHFDPLVVEAFFSGLDEILTIRKEVDGLENINSDQFIFSERDQDGSK